MSKLAESTTNIRILRLAAAELETLLNSVGDQFPEYLRQSGQQFINDLKEFSIELEKPDEVERSSTEGKPQVLDGK